MKFFNQSKEKFRQIASFYKNSNTPIALTLDSLKLKKRSFIAQSKEGLKLSLRPSVGESFTFYENLIRQDYLRHGIQLNQGDTVIDIGANIGAFTVLAASIVGTQGQVLAFEPEATTFKCLLKNIQLNNLKNVIAINQAIDQVTGNAELRVGDKSAFSNIHGRLDHLNSIAAQTVKTTTLTQVFENYHLTSVKLMKVDCEGSEYRIFDTLPQSIASCIEQIAMEVHRINGRQPSEITNRLEALGFEAYQTHPFTAFRVS